MERRAKLRSSQNTSEALQQSGVAAFSQTTELDWDLF